LGATRAGDLTECRLRLTENRRLSRGKAHVARQHEFAAGGPYAPLDLCDGNEAAISTNRMAPSLFTLSVSKTICESPWFDGWRACR
jgi:hypothetical protein